MALYLATGGAEFIGSRIANEFVRRCEIPRFACDSTFVTLFTLAEGPISTEGLRTADSCNPVCHASKAEEFL